MKNPDLSTVLAEEQRIMDEYATDYDSATLANSYVYQLERKNFFCWMMKIVRGVGDPTRMSVLDAGCATGATLEYLEQEGFAQLTGLDLSPGMLEVANSRALSRTTLLQGSIEQPPFRDQYFDVIVSIFTVHHLLDPGAFFRMVDRVLKPGGHFFLLEYDIDCGVAGAGGEGLRRKLGDLARACIAWKNRRALAGKPQLLPQFNPAHRLLNLAAIREAIPNPERYELRQESHGFVLPAFLPVLVENSVLDQGIVYLAGGIDRYLMKSRSGLFQWIVGLRLE